MLQLDVPDRWAGRVMNVHPALLPAFGGKGMYGHFVHEAVLRHGCRVTGATVHFVDNEYDHGPIVLQKAVEVLADDTPDSLAERVQGAEREIYPEAVRLFAAGRLRIEGRRVRIA
jgi:phosphoribosylglycinamide formyltransferase-1